MMSCDIYCSALLFDLKHQHQLWFYWKISGLVISVMFTLWCRDDNSRRCFEHLECHEAIVKLSLTTIILKPISQSFACFGNNASRRCFLLGMTVPAAVILSSRSSSNKGTLVKYRSHVMLRFDSFNGLTSFLMTLDIRCRSITFLGKLWYGIVTIMILNIIWSQ